MILKLQSKQKRVWLLWLAADTEGFCNALEYAKKVTGEKRIFAALGGFHLRKLEEKKDIIDKTIEYLNKMVLKNCFLVTA